MFRMTLAAIAVALVAPALAHAATARGTVAAKQTSRHVLVIALRHGDVMSARVTPLQLHKARVGTRLTLTGKRLADGSLHVNRLRRLGRARHALLHVVVMQAKARQLVVAGGGSTFAIRLDSDTRLLASARGSAHPGENVDAEVEFSHGDAVGKEVHSAGEAPLIEFSGVVTAIDATSFTVTSEGIATVVQLPEGVVLPAIVKVGSEVEVVASISGSTLTLATIKLDGESENGGSCVDGEGQVETEGVVTSLDAGLVTIQPGDNASPITFTVPGGFTLPGALAVGSVVEARGEMVNDVLTLTRIELKTDDGDHAMVEAEGTVTAFDGGSITIQTAAADGGGGSTTFVFVVPEGFVVPDQLAVGSLVEARGEMVNGVLTLATLELQDASGGGTD
jgi:hypothetical protein